ncbi:MAG: superoxide dismutase family protein [Sphingomonadaceae bacterium]|nr:superoxide dismutase family protein [Sphingomonadaceae bacterium]
MRHFTIIAAAGALAACATTPSSQPSADFTRASAALFDSGGTQSADADLMENDDGIGVTIRAYGLTPGVHAVHIHETGNCDAYDFSSAAGHWNPLDREHGRESPGGQHMGDMPNLVIGQAGEGLIELTIEGARVSGGRTALLDEDGAAVVIHALPDDYRSQPSGAAGERIACGVVEPAGY